MGLKKIGGGWTRTAKSNGEKFVSIDLDGRQLLMFKNKKKEGGSDKQPDYAIFETVDDEPAKDTTPAMPEYPQDDLQPDDIPF